MATKKTKALPLTAQGKTMNNGISGEHVKKPAVKKLARSGSVSGAAKPAVVNDSAKKVAAKKPAAAKSHKPVSPSETPAPNSSTQSAASSAHSSAKQERNVNTASPISDKKLMREIMNGIVEANKREEDNAKFLDLVVSMVAIAAGRFFGVSTYERLIRAALHSSAIKERKPLFTGLADAIAREKALAATPKIQNSSLSGAHVTPATPPLFKKTADITLASAPDGGKPEAIAAAITKAVDALNGTSNISRKDITRVVTREVQGTEVSLTTQVNGNKLAYVLTDAFMRAEETLMQFRVQDRSALRAFVTFFERFWGVIENRVDMTLDYSDSTFRRFVSDNLPQILTHGEYARYTFTCGSRVIVHHTFAGTAVMVIAPNEFVSQLKRMPFADKQAVDEQAQKNPPTFSFNCNIPMGLSALVRCDVDQPGLSLMVLNRVFGDPIDYTMHNGDTCLATHVESLLDHLVDCEARVPRKAA